MHRKPQWFDLVLAALAAFCVYFCMYAFRKPFTAGTYENQEVFGFGFKATVVASQLIGYMISKFVGIKVVSEMPANRRAISILALIGLAELSLVGFAYFPPPFKVVMMFCNGLPLGMVFGLVLSYLEGRRQTEALSAVLCASFIISSGVVKSLGRWLVVDQGVSEYSMPMIVGLMFCIPLLITVWILQRTPPPSQEDVEQRTARRSMSATERRGFVSAYWPGLSLLVFVYAVLTIVRTARDDFGVEIWRDLGVSKQPEVFAQSETLVAVFVTALNGLAMLIVSNFAALRTALGLMSVAFGLALAAALAQANGALSPMLFMVMCGVGLYVPYVAFHTTVFERLIALSRKPCNLAFLMYLADAIGYLGYAAVLYIPRKTEAGAVLPLFRWILIAGAIASFVSLIASAVYFRVKLASPTKQTVEPAI